MLPNEYENGHMKSRLRYLYLYQILISPSPSAYRLSTPIVYTGSASLHLIVDHETKKCKQRN